VDPGYPVSGNLFKAATSGRREGCQFGWKSTVIFKTQTSLRNLNSFIAFLTMKRTFKIHINQRGFTMIEMIVVLIVMAIMGTYIMSRVTISGNDLIAQTEILKSHLRYAQIKAMNDTDVNAPGGWGIYLPSSNSYTLYRNNVAASDILPGENTQTHTLPSGTTVSTNCANATCNFNEWGSPGATTLTMTLTHGTSTSTISITKNTGFVN
jgi:prepilin-type N-terminal cleavage/methylation domain-containing protein